MRLRTPSRRRPTSFLSLQQLENRLVPATIMVTDPGDNGDAMSPIPNSLRWANKKANDEGGFNTIKFALTGGSKITLLGPISFIYPTDIDGQPTGGVPAIEISGGGLTLGESGTVRGLIINNAYVGGLGALTMNQGGLVEDCYIGTTADGTSMASNYYGLTTGGPSVTVRNCVIAGNLRDAHIGSTSSLIENCYFGTDKTGSVSLMNDILFTGVYIASETSSIKDSLFSGYDDETALGTLNKSISLEDCFIGTNKTGTIDINNGYGADIDADEVTLKNCVISGNDIGLYVGHFLPCETLTIEDCFIGTDFEGKNAITAPSGNSSDFVADMITIKNNVISSGIVITSNEAGSKFTGNMVGTDMAGTKVLNDGGAGIELKGPGWTVGGDGEDRNIISGRNIGLTLEVTNSKVRNNYFGTNKAGSAALPNYLGIFAKNASGLVIGGTDASHRNLIANGVRIEGETGPGNSLQGNYIGTNSSGLTVLTGADYGYGINIKDVTANWEIGGTDAGERNVIGGFGTAGILVGYCNGLTVSGNYVGVGANGATGIGNKGDGIFVFISKLCKVSNNLVGDNGGDGIKLGFNAPFGEHTVQGNTVGFDGAHLAVPGNKGNGIAILGSAKNIIGGTTSGLENHVAGNLKSGLFLTASTSFNSVQGNTFLSNKEYGILIAGANNNYIGGGSGGNFLVQNGESLKLKGHGIEVASGIGNWISRNSFSNNYGRGIDLNNDSFDINTPGGDNLGGIDNAKANKLQDYPVVVHRSVGADGVATTKWRLDGKPFTNYVVEFFQNANLDPSGFGEGVFVGDTSLTANTTGVHTFDFFVPGFKLMSATATELYTEPMSGMTVGNTSEFSMVDTDCDGAADAWETEDMGIDFNEDGFVDLDLYAVGGRPDHRSVYVEVDAVTGFAPPAAIFDPLTTPPNGGVVQAFAAAPNASIHNPDGMNGVSLHVFIDDTNIPADADNNYHPVWTEFDRDKDGAVAGDHRDGYFGTKFDRYMGGNPLTPNPNWDNVRGARQLVYRYCIFANSYSKPDGTPSLSSGLAEGSVVNIAVNDFIVTVPPNFFGPMSPSNQDLAGTFMHELGHTIGLDHGGSDFANYKPNYFSVMNYNWQVPNSAGRTTALGLTVAEGAAYTAAWKLDYSHQQLKTLTENMLNETTGVTDILGNHPLAQVVYGLGDSAENFLDFRIEAGGGNINWNRSLPNTDNPTKADINFNGSNGTKADPWQTLNGYDDWSNLIYYFLESPESVNYAHGVDGHHDDDVPVGNLPPAKIHLVTINDGTSPQRSRIDSVTIDFDQYVNFTAAPEGSFQILKHGSITPVELTATVGGTSTRTSVTLTFNGGGGEYGSLADGRYTFSVFGANISNVWGMLDGNGDGNAGGDYVLDCAKTGTPTNLFRNFGDVDGNGTVTSNDFAEFRKTFGTNLNLAFDFDNDGNITSNDFANFRKRFGVSI